MVQQAFARRAPETHRPKPSWFERLTAQGKAKPGRALERTGAIVSGRNGRFVTDGPFAESKEAIGGYLVLDVETIEEAIANRAEQPRPCLWQFNRSTADG
jgi:Uncharacterized protein conserved in bacteria